LRKVEETKKKEGQVNETEYTNRMGKKDANRVI
jgi:hypothetical protein